MPEGPVFLLIAKLLKTKEIQEYVDAAKQVERSHPGTRFVLVGPMDSSPDGVSQAKLDEWIEAGIDYIGPLSDVRSAVMSLGVAFQMKGLGLASLYSRMKRLMAACRSTAEWKTPHLSRRRVSLAKKSSTALSHEHEVGVKWSV
jgi:hypothetical protein